MTAPDILADMRARSIAACQKRLARCREEWKTASSAEREQLAKWAERDLTELELQTALEAEKLTDVAAGLCTPDAWELLHAMGEQLLDRTTGEVSPAAVVVAAENLAMIEEYAGLIDDIYAVAYPPPLDPVFANRVRTVRDGALEEVVYLSGELGEQRGVEA